MNLYLRFFLLSAPVLVLLVIYGPTESFFSNQYDDSYITYRYAINLAEGNGLVFNIGERTDAASSFLYTLILSVSWLLGIKNLEFLGGLVGVISLGIICLYVYKLAIRLTHNIAAALVVAIACGLNGFLSGWALSGMETLPWTAIVLIAIYLMVAKKNYIFVISVITIAVFTRFEGILLVPSYLLLLLLNRNSSRSEYASLAGVVAVFCLFYIVKYEYYGVWISHAFKLKEISEYYKPAPRDIIHHWKYFGYIPFILGTYGLLRKSNIPVLAYISLSLLSVMLGPRSDWSRYSVHLLPLFYAFSAIGLAKILSIRRELIGKTVFTALASLMLAQSIKGQRFNWINMTELAEHQACRKKLGQYIRLAIPTSEYLASSDIGAISYMAIDHRFVDLAALTSADVLANYEQGRTADDILITKHVSYIADSFSSTEKNRFDTLLTQFPRVIGKSHFNIVSGNPEFRCSSSATLGFQLTKIIHKNDTN